VNEVEPIYYTFIYIYQHITPTIMVNSYIKICNCT